MCRPVPIINNQMKKEDKHRRGRRENYQIYIFFIKQYEFTSTQRRRSSSSCFVPLLMTSFRKALEDRSRERKSGARSRRRRKSFHSNKTRAKGKANEGVLMKKHRPAERGEEKPSRNNTKLNNRFLRH
jgi:dTDP-4-amino-4,6-dideoxygalactose transaminase